MLSINLKKKVMYLVSIQSSKNPQPQMYYSENALIIEDYVEIMPSDVVVHISEVKSLRDLNEKYHEQHSESSEVD